MDAPTISETEKREKCMPAETASPYEGLGDKQIRLLEILPSHENDTISCRLTARELKSHGGYVAVSYTWGRPDINCHMTLNGRKFQVRKNLLRLLLEISKWSNYKSTLFWIDAICIDQSNARERSEQVELMAQIYEGAEHVLVWLGPSYADSDLAMKALARDPNYWKRYMKMERVFWRPEGAGIKRLCERAYWTRLWVLQELVHAKSAVLVCGSKSISWKTFVDFCELASSCSSERKSESFEHVAFKRSPALSMMWQVQRTTYMSESTLFDLIIASRSLACSEPRDKVYALLGVARIGQHFISPDYSVSLVQLGNAVLRGHHFARPPMTMKTVSQQCHDLKEILGVEIATYDEPSTSLRSPSPVPPLAPYPGISLWWIDQYDHVMIRQIWLGHHKQRDIDKILFNAAASGDVAVIKMLLNLGAWNDIPAQVKLNCTNDNGQRPIIEAARLGHVNVLKLLLEQNETLVHSLDDQQLNAMYHAVVDGNTQVVNLLLQQPQVRINGDCCPGMKMPILYLAFEYGHTEIVRLLIQRPELDVNASYRHWKSPVDLAIYRRSLPIVELLLSRKDFRWSERSPLHTAVRTGNTDIVNFLLDNNLVSPNVRDHKKQTALFVAIAEWRANIAFTLLDHEDIDVNAQDIDGNTALHWAARHQNEHIQDRLLACEGLDFNVRNEKGHTALHDAVTYENDRMQVLILGSGKCVIKNVDGVVVRGLSERALEVYWKEAERQGVNVGWGLGVSLGRAVKSLGGATGK